MVSSMYEIHTPRISPLSAVSFVESVTVSSVDACEIVGVFTPLFELIATTLKSKTINIEIGISLLKFKKSPFGVDYMQFNILVVYLLIINLIAIVVTIIDKVLAIKNMWRIRERTLFAIAILGGSVGMYITMQIIRHKTKHLSFMIGIPIIFVCQCLLVFFAFGCFNVNMLDGRSIF